MSKIVRLVNDNIVDFGATRIKIINEKYMKLKKILNDLELKRLNLSINLSKIDKEMYRCKCQLDKLETEILKDLKRSK